MIGNGNVAEDGKHVTASDIIATISYFLNALRRNRNNRRHRPLEDRHIPFGKLKPIPYYQFYLVWNVVRERMSIQDTAAVTPQQLVNIRPVVAAIKEFFRSSQLSQIMDQTNPLGG